MNETNAPLRSAEKFFLPNSMEKKSGASHGKSGENGIEECHQGIGRAYGCQRLRPDITADNPGVRQIIELLQDISGHQRQGEFPERRRNFPLCQIFFHSFSMRYLSPNVCECKGTAQGGNSADKKRPVCMHTGRYSPYITRCQRSGSDAVDKMYRSISSSSW